MKRPFDQTAFGIDAGRLADEDAQRRHITSDDPNEPIIEMLIPDDGSAPIITHRDAQRDLDIVCTPYERLLQAMIEDMEDDE